MRSPKGWWKGGPLRPSPSCLPGWEAELPGARGVLAAFISARPGLLLGVPQSTGAGRAWPSPRSWELAARLWAAASAAGVSDEAHATLVAGCVGEGPALEWLSFLSDLDLPDPEALLADPASFELPERGDLALAVLSAVAAAVVERTTGERWEAAWQIVERAAASHPDVAATAARSLARCRPDGAAAPESAAALVPVLTAAGLLKRAS